MTTTTKVPKDPVPSSRESGCEKNAPNPPLWVELACKKAEGLHHGSVKITFVAGKAKQIVREESELIK